MPSIYLDVPYVTQLAIGGDRTRNDWVGCWYASACMLGYYFESGPRRGDPTLAGPSGLHQTIVDATNLNKNENLVEVPQPTSPQEWQIDGLAILLRKWGPLLISLNRTASPHWRVNGATGAVDLAEYAWSHQKVRYGHCCALIGADEKSKHVIYHDPENAPNSQMNIKKFNKDFMWITDGMLRKNVPAHTPKQIHR